MRQISDYRSISVIIKSNIACYSVHSALLSSYSREGTRRNVHNLPSLFDIGLTDLAEGLGENVSSCPLVPTAQCTHVKEEERKASSQPLTLA